MKSLKHCTWSLALTLLLGLSLWPTISVATINNCAESYEVAQLADQLAPHLLAAMKSFGVDVQTQVESCKDYKEEQIRVMRVAVGWIGPFTGDVYQAKGQLTVTPSG